MKKNLLALFLLFTFVFQSSALAQTATRDKSAARNAAETITAAQLKDYLYFVASDEMEGRNTPSRGLDLTAKFMATMLSRWGFKPAGDDGTFYQKMALVRNQVNPEKAQLEINGQKMIYGTDFLADAVSSRTDAPLVFGGNGWFVKSKNLDPLKDVDARGKTVVVYSDNLPRGMTFSDLAASGKRGEDWADPQTYAKQKGAVGLIIVSTPTIQAGWENLRRFREQGRLAVEKLRESTVPTIYLTDKAGEALLNGETTNFTQIKQNFQSNAPLNAFNFSANKKVNFSVDAKKDVTMTQNVVALWEGSDPQLKAEMVAVGAHYDHDGIKPNAKGEDKIWNGADDDGSGTVAVLAIAEALANSPKKPKRSILLVWHAGEEKGLWGSEYFNKFPTVNIKNVVAQLNIDMIGRSKKAGDTNPKNKDLSGESEVYVIGSQMMSTKLGQVTKSVNDSFLKLNYNYKYDDPKDTNRFFFRSDHFNYAVNGIPIIFWFDGVHEDYHQASDHADKIDYQKMEKISRTILLTMWEIADLKERPAVDKQLPAELTKR
ncbi:MAG TPA: M20/M25/M40 family metallo-hydrolase [Pyrinomonadaceae bacterium]|nr:M20/M25/M40 family metallo-hydrolase [Pyrinomonadaceae bacterium]